MFSLLLEIIKVKPNGVISVYLLPSGPPPEGYARYCLLVVSILVWITFAQFFEAHSLLEAVNLCVLPIFVIALFLRNRYYSLPEPSLPFFLLYWFISVILAAIPTIWRSFILGKLKDATWGPSWRVSSFEVTGTDNSAPPIGTPFSLSFSPKGPLNRTTVSVVWEPKFFNNSRISRIIYHWLVGTHAPETCRYIGYLGCHGLPHGFGTWVSGQLEIRGQWREGIPVAPFQTITPQTATVAIRIVGAEIIDSDNLIKWHRVSAECCVSGNPLPGYPHILTSQKHHQLNEDGLTAIQEYAKSHGNTLLPKKAFIYIHGFHTYLEKASKSLGQLLAMMELPPTDIVPILFAWPTTMKFMGYKESRRALNDPSHLLGKAFERLIQELAAAGIEKVDVFSHSFGAEVAINVLEYTNSLFIGEKPKMVLNSTTFVAADCSLRRFVGRGFHPLRRACPIITFYSDRNDVALCLRQGILRSPPVGRQVNGLRSSTTDEWLDADVIDTTRLEANADPSRHCFFTVNRCLADDLADILLRGIRAHHRNTRLLKLRGNVFTFKTLPIHIGSV